mmetsp:Transcript_27608/g.41135  ORF Transcript_27608/g.41135 Transcript_27608/m.41135 type:complete len:131 (-) Transcript_27608:9-401(-)
MDSSSQLRSVPAPWEWLFQSCWSLCSMKLHKNWPTLSFSQSMAALTFNFLSGLSVCLGGVIFLAADPSDVATGIILAMAGGVYINIAACETAPRMEAAMKVRGDRVLMLFSIILGTIPLGLILLDHKHCD